MDNIIPFPTRQARSEPLLSIRATIHNLVAGSAPTRAAVPSAFLREAAVKVRYIANDTASEHERSVRGALLAAAMLDYADTLDRAANGDDRQSNFPENDCSRES